MSINEEFLSEFYKAYEYLGQKGERVLGAAFLDLGQDQTKYNLRLKNYPISNLCFIGLFSLMDPPKKGVAEAISAAHIAGTSKIRPIKLLFQRYKGSHGYR